jgi:hypothetical protein
MTDEPEDLPEALHDAQRASTNSAVLTVITILFGVVWLADLDRIPAWIVSVWFIFVIPLNLYLLFMYRRRYRTLREMHDGDQGGGRD